LVRFILAYSRTHSTLHSFPTRRSSDLERGGPAPARLENRRVEDRLHQCFAHRIGMQVAEHLLQRERMRRAERQEDALLRRRRLQDRKSTRLNSSHQIISYAVFCLKKKN